MYIKTAGHSRYPTNKNRRLGNLQMKDESKSKDES